MKRKTKIGIWASVITACLLLVTMNTVYSISPIDETGLLIRNSKGNTWYPNATNIQLAINDLIDIDGGAVYLPPVQYDYDETTYLISNLEIIGSGAKTVMKSIPLSTANAFQANDKHNITIRDLSINGNKYEHSWEQFQKHVSGTEKHNSGIMLENCDDCLIENVNVYDMPNLGILAYRYCNRITTRDCNVWECEWHGIEYWCGIYDSTIVDCYARDCWKEPIVVELGGNPLTQFCTVENCIVSDDGSGQYAGIRIQSCYKINVVGNTIINGNIRSAGGKESNIVGNYIYDGGIVVSSGDNCNIASNYIYDSPANGMYINSDYCSVTSNYVYNPNRFGIDIRSSYNKISDNYIKGSVRDAIIENDDSCDFNYIVDNYLIDNGGTIVQNGVNSVIGYNFGY